MVRTAMMCTTYVYPSRRWGRSDLGVHLQLGPLGLILTTARGSLSVRYMAAPGPRPAGRRKLPGGVLAHMS